MPHSPTQLPAAFALTAEQLQSLREAATVARLSAYAPYSSFQVGAAILANGRLFTGANVENASYGLCVCAERNAIMQAVLAGHLQVEAVFVVTDATPPASPCGMCRQVIAEFAVPGAQVFAQNLQGQQHSWTTEQLLPAGFTKAQLPPKP